MRALLLISSLALVGCQDTYSKTGTFSPTNTASPASAGGDEDAAEQNVRSSASSDVTRKTGERSRTFDVTIPGARPN